MMSSRFVLVGAMACAAACSGLSSTPTQSPRGTRALPAGSEFAARGDLQEHIRDLRAQVRRVFLSDSALNIVTIFGAKGRTRELSGFQEPQGLTMDRSGTLYVANTAAYEVEAFHPPYRGKPHKVFDTAPEFPIDVSVAPNGTIAILNVCGGTGYNCYQSGSVYFYANENATAPCATVSGDSKISRLLWGAFDASGMLYVTGENDYTTIEVGAIAGGCGAKSLRLLRPNVNLTFPAGIQVDPQGRIAIVDSHGFSGPPNLDVFSRPKNDSRRLEIATQSTLSDSSIVASFALTQDGKALYTAEPHYSLKYPYPAGGAAIGLLSPPPSGGDLIEGVTVAPGESP